MEEILGDIPGVIVYIDDILVFADTMCKLRESTKKVLKALEDNNLTLNREKCEYEVEETEFLGHELTKEGFNIAKKKVQDVLAFVSPSSVTELTSFLGLASFVAAYIANFADISKPLWDATKEAQFAWNDEREIAFNELKRAIADCTVKQGFFDGSDPTYTDASPNALGAVLVQSNNSGDFRVIAFASRLLSPTERRYPQCQREALSIVWGTEHFWFYLIGRRFTIRTDAEGIAFIFKRDQAPTKRIMKREDAWALRMDAFEYDVEHIKGESNIADPSSRLVKGVGVKSFDDNPTPGEIMSCSIEIPNDITFADGIVTIEEIVWHAQRDQVMKEVMKALDTNDWPRALGKFKTVRHELREVEGVLTRMGEIVVPEALRPKILTTDHMGHPGENAMKSAMRGKVWWPGMLAQTERWVRDCTPC